MPSDFFRVLDLNDVDLSREASSLHNLCCKMRELEDGGKPLLLKPTMAIGQPA